MRKSTVLALPPNPNPAAQGDPNPGPQAPNWTHFPLWHRRKHLTPNRKLKTIKGRKPSPTPTPDASPKQSNRKVANWSPWSGVEAEMPQGSEHERTHRRASQSKAWRDRTRSPKHCFTTLGHSQCDRLPGSTCESIRLCVVGSLRGLQEKRVVSELRALHSGEA